MVTFWAILKYTTLQVKVAVATFWTTFGLLWIPTSGHTDRSHPPPSPFSITHYLTLPSICERKNHLKLKLKIVIFLIHSLSLPPSLSLSLPKVWFEFEQTCFSILSDWKGVKLCCCSQRRRTTTDDADGDDLSKLHNVQPPTLVPTLPTWHVRHGDL